MFYSNCKGIFEKTQYIGMKEVSYIRKLMCLFQKHKAFYGHYGETVICKDNKSMIVPGNA